MAQEQEQERGVRLHKHLARCGVASRRACEALIEQGRVEVDGMRVREQGMRVRPERQEIRVDGEAVRREKPVYYLVNKPKGFLCTNEAGCAPRRVIDLLAHEGRRLYVAGRLDAASEGLVFVTNDGEVANRLAHPRYEVPKTYRVRVRGRVGPEGLERLRRGVFLAEGKIVPSRVVITDREASRTEMEVVVTEGRNREVRRIMAAIGAPVKKLVRTAIGPFRLGDLPPGAFRRLAPEGVREQLRDMPAGK